MLKQISDKFPDNSKSSSLDVYNSVIQKRNHIAKFVGVSVFSTDYTPLNVAFVFLMVDLCSYIPINIYSVILFKDDFVKMIFCLVTLGLYLLRINKALTYFICITGFGFQGFAKIYLLLVNRKDVFKINDTIRDFHNLDFNANIKSSILTPYATVSVLIIKLIDMAYLICAIVICLYPLFVYLGTNELILHFGFILPWVDENAIHGYVLNVFHHILQVVLVAVG